MSLNDAYGGPGSLVVVDSRRVRDPA